MINLKYKILNLEEKQNNLIKYTKIIFFWIIIVRADKKSPIIKLLQVNN